MTCFPLRTMGVRNSLGFSNRLAVITCLLTEKYDAYREKGTPGDVIIETFKDVSLRAGLYREKTGEAGLSKDDVIWFRHIMNINIFKLGTLQFQPFEMIYLDEETLKSLSGIGTAANDCEPLRKLPDAGIRGQVRHHRRIQQPAVAEERPEWVGRSAFLEKASRFFQRPGGHSGIQICSALYMAVDDRTSRGYPLFLLPRKRHVRFAEGFLIQIYHFKRP